MDVPKTLDPVEPEVMPNALEPVELPDEPKIFELVEAEFGAPNIPPIGKVLFVGDDDIAVPFVPPVAKVLDDPLEGNEVVGVDPNSDDEEAAELLLGAENVVDGVVAALNVNAGIVVEVMDWLFDWLDVATVDGNPAPKVNGLSDEAVVVGVGTDMLNENGLASVDVNAVGAALKENVGADVVLTPDPNNKADDFGAGSAASSASPESSSPQAE